MSAGYHAGGQIRCERDASWTTTGSSASRGPWQRAQRGPGSDRTSSAAKYAPSGAAPFKARRATGLSTHCPEKTAHPAPGGPVDQCALQRPAGQQDRLAPPARRRKPYCVLIDRRQQGVLDGLGRRAQLREQGQDQMQDRRLRQGLRARGGRSAGDPVGARRLARGGNGGGRSLRHASLLVQASRRTSAESATPVRKTATDGRATGSGAAGRIARSSARDRAPSRVGLAVVRIRSRFAIARRTSRREPSGSARRVNRISPRRQPVARRVTMDRRPRARRRVSGVGGGTIRGAATSRQRP